MPQFSTQLLNNIKTDLQQSKSSTGGEWTYPSIFCCVWHCGITKKHYFWTTLLQYTFDLIMPQITNYSVNASVLDSEFVSI